MIAAIKDWAARIKLDVAALAIAMRDPRTPRFAKLVAVLVVAYALSPVDLIPDFVPVLGFLDELVLLPAGILLVVRLIPGELMAEFRERAREAEKLPLSKLGAALVITLWVIVGVAVLWRFAF